MEENDHRFRVSRRRALRGAALAGTGIAATALLACNTAQESAPSSPVATAPQPKRGGTLVRRTQTTAYNGGIDPHIQQGSQTGEMSLFYQTLVRTNPFDFTIEPELAQKWEQTTPTEYVLTLAPNVKWHNKPPVNGRVLVADDVVYSLERLRNNDPRFLNRSLFDAVDRIEARDKGTVRITTKQPDATTITNLAALSAKILAPELVEKTDKFATPETGIGTGPFVLQTWSDAGVLAVRNPDYWKPGLPYLDAVNMAVFKESLSEWSAFLAGQLDFAYVPGNESKKVFAEQADRFNLQWFKDVSYTGIQANLDRKPFDDARVTRALRLLVDHQEAKTAYAEVWWGRGYITVAFGSNLADWDFTEDEYSSKFLEWKQPKDEAVRESMRLLGAAGFTKDNPLKFVLNGQRGIGGDAFTNAFSELFHGQLMRLGQGVVQPTELRLLEQAVNRQALTVRDFDYAVISLVPAQPFDPDDWFRTFFRTGGSRNYGRFSDTRLDQLIDKQKSIFDLAQRKTAVKDVLTYLADNGPYTSFSGRNILNAAKPTVQDWAPEGISAIWAYQYERTWMNT